MRRAVRAEENVMKVATNIQQQQLQKKQKKVEETNEDKLPVGMIIKTIFTFITPRSYDVDLGIDGTEDTARMVMHNIE